MAVKIQGFILYRFYYGSDIVYLGRTKQPLQNRIRGHLFKKAMHRSIEINLVTKIEYAEFKTEADMNLYEIYYINLLKPPLNIDDKCKDQLTVHLPEEDWEFEALRDACKKHQRAAGRNGYQECLRDRAMLEVLRSTAVRVGEFISNMCIAGKTRTRRYLYLQNHLMKDCTGLA